MLNLNNISDIIKHEKSIEESIPRSIKSQSLDNKILPESLEQVESNKAVSKDDQSIEKSKKASETTSKKRGKLTFKVLNDNDVDQAHLNKFIDLIIYGPD
jgi:hypothetical protein